MRNILVTGATGFTGRRVVPLLLERFGKITCLVRPNSDCDAISLPGVNFVVGDMGDRASLSAALNGHDTLVNIASLGFGHAPGLLDACLEAGIQRGVFISTTGIFTALNADSKGVRLAAEGAIMRSGIAYTILRPTMIYGAPGDRNMIRLLRFLKASPVIPILGSGEFLQQPIHVDDLARAIVGCLTFEASEGHAYNLSGAVPLSYNQIVDTACDALGVHRVKLHVPLGLSLWAARQLERVLKRSPVKEEQILRLNENKAFSHTAAQQDFGFAPRAFKDGIREEVALIY
jgi:uncharacterized protein YbjT (DUF2867 family)